jgi:glycosyltransferase involved in cell wall biosynthesis
MPKSKTRKKPQKKRVAKRPTKPVAQQDKIKVLGYCDAPTCATGFGTVSRNVFEGLQRTGRYQIDVLGINYWGDPHDFPYRIWPTGTNQEKDPYGRQKVMNMIPQMDFDILFLLQDSFILEFVPKLMEHLRKNRAKPFKSILYYPVDSIVKQPWAENVNPADYLVAYSEFGKKETLRRIDRPDMEVIPHGVNTAEYHPLPKEEIAKFRKQYFGPFADHFVITNVNRNQQRKDIPRTIAAFKEFRKQVPKSILYLHMAMKDQGWDLVEVCKSYELDISKDVIFPKNFGPNQGYPRHILNMLYNCSDVVVSTTLGEGFGLAWMEAMGAKTPIVMPANTMLPEFITEETGWMCDSGSDPSLWTVIQFDNEVPRPLIDVDSLVEVLVEIHNNPEEAKRRAENAYKWVNTKMDWQRNIAPTWVKLFDKAYTSMQQEQEKLDEGVDTTINQIGKKKTIETEEF